MAKWKAIGTGLGIKRGRLDEIEAAHPGDPSECLAEVLTTWLRKGYNVKRFGEPTWQKLVQALSDPAAGSNPALALTIAKKHSDECKCTCNDCTMTLSILRVESIFTNPADSLPSQSGVQETDQSNGGMTDTHLCAHGIYLFFCLQMTFHHYVFHVCRSQFYEVTLQ